MDQEDTVIRDDQKSAYEAVLRAFMYQSDEIPLEKQVLLGELRAELKVSDNEHREFLDKLLNDDTFKRIRKWNKEKTGSGCSHQLSRESKPETSTITEREPKTRSVNELVYGLKAEDLGRVFWIDRDGGQDHNDFDEDDPKDSDYDPNEK